MSWNVACNQEAVLWANVSYEDYFIKMAMCLHMIWIHLQLQYDILVLISLSMQNCRYNVALHSSHWQAVKLHNAMSTQGSWWVSQRRSVKTRKLKRDKRNVIWRTNTRRWKSATICTSSFSNSCWCSVFGDGTLAAYASGIGHSRPKTCPPKGDFCPNAYTESPHMIQICQKHRN